MRPRTVAEDGIERALTLSVAVTLPSMPEMLLPSVRARPNDKDMGPLSNSRYWRERAEEATTMAEAMRDPVARQLMLDVATEYLELAQQAEQRETAVHTPYLS
jgi:hypothetical protein